MVDSTHQQGAVELHCGGREQLLILKEAGFHLVHRQGLHLPVKAVKLQTIELPGSPVTE